ncbi:hypothetical protein E8E13_002952 [Curvularia kusanoi]|uniref:Secreted protein n=1 Tax=Curvularia kusanoi TaxID=90978 RepID=A0A9P4TE42_CURKU|nr:hypothetical protein E8E13_002952 [Curvularia kusanoi]
MITPKTPPTIAAVGVWLCSGVTPGAAVDVGIPVDELWLTTLASDELLDAGSVDNNVVEVDVVDVDETELSVVGVDEVRVAVARVVATVATDVVLDDPRPEATEDEHANLVGNHGYLHRSGDVSLSAGHPAPGLHASTRQHPTKPPEHL